MADSETVALLANVDKRYQAIDVDLVALENKEVDGDGSSLNLGFSVCDDNHTNVRAAPVTEGLQDTPLSADDLKPERDRVPSERELTFRLKFAHLTPQTCWFDEVQNVSRATDDIGVYTRVLACLRDYPLTIREKIRLSEKIRAKLDAMSVTSSGSKLVDNENDNRPGKNRRKQRRFHRLGLSAPFGLWEDNIGQIAAYFGSHVASYFQFLRFLALMNAGIAIIMFMFVSLPQIVHTEVWSSDVRSGFFGELSNTIFFYGAYYNTSVALTVGNLSYNRPLAYLMTWSIANVMVIFMIVFSMFVRYRRVKKGDDSQEEPFSRNTFQGWDYSVTSKEGSKIRSLAITTHMKEMLREEMTKRDRTSRETLNMLCARLACNFLSVSILATSSYLIFYVANVSIKPGLDIPGVVDDFMQEYQLAIVIMCLKVFIPPLLSLLLRLERYHPRTEIKLQIARTAVFYIANLIVFLASMYSVATKCLTLKPPNQKEYCCWENEVGEKLFEVVVLDLAFTLVVGVVFTGGRAAIVKVCQYTKFGCQDFNVGDLILDLVYGQSLICLGLFFAPFVALVGTIKLVILFYFNYVLAWTCCVPPTKVFRASRSGTFYLFVLLVTLFICLLPMTYAVIQLQPSTSCGPFRDHLHTYQVLTDQIGDAPTWVQNILTYVITPAVVTPVFIVLLLIIFYYHTKSTVHKMEAKDLHYLLQFERKVEKRRMLARAKLYSVSTIGVVNT